MGINTKNIDFQQLFTVTNIALLCQAICIGIGTFALANAAKALAKQISGFWESTSRNNSCIKSLGNIPLLYLLAIESTVIFILLSQLFAVIFVSIEANPGMAITKLISIGCASLALSMVAGAMATQTSKLFESASNEPETIEKAGNYPILYLVIMESVAIFVVVSEGLILFLVN